jgi:hypothetical protein
VRLEACRKECAFYQEHGKRFRRHHLENRKCIALKQEDEEAFQKISAIIQREQQQFFWRKLNYVTGKKKTRSATSIQVEGPDGIIMERTTQETVEQMIFSEIHKKRYTLAGEAPICNGDLFQEFGYSNDTCIACGIGRHVHRAIKLRFYIGTFCRNRPHPQIDPSQLSVNRYYTRAMESILASGQRRNVLL